MLSFKREDTKQYSSAEALVTVTFRIPDAAESDVILAEIWKDSKIFEKFVKEIKSADIEGWENGIKAEEVVKMPGIYSLVHLVSLDIVDAMRGDFKRKK